MKMLKTLITLSLILSPLALGKTDRKTEVRYSDLASILLNFYGQTEQEAKLTKMMSDNMSALLAEENQQINAEIAVNKEIQFKNPTEYEMMSAGFKAMRRLRAYRSDEMLLQSALPTVTNLEFFKLGSALFPQLDRTKTVPGRIVLAAMLANPLVDAKKLEKQQRLLTTLLENEELFNSLDAITTEFKSQQNALFSYWLNHAELNTMMDQQLVTKFGYDLRNKPQQVVHALHRYADRSPEYNAALVGFTANAMLIFLKSKDFITEWKTLAASELAILAMSAGVGAFDHFANHASNLDRVHAITYVHKRALALAKVLRATKTLHQLMGTHDSLSAGLKNASVFSEMENNSQAFSPSFNAIKAAFAKPSFADDASYETMDIGLVLHTDVVMRRSLNEFASFFEAIGEIDAYLAIVRLVKESQASHLRYCLAEFVYDGVEDPMLELENFWHPALDPLRAVTNDISMKQGFRGLVLTGTNTAGKSTTLKAMLMAALLNQGLSIAPATKSVSTPFALLGSFINVTDNIRDRSSLLDSEVQGARKLIDVAKDVAHQQKFGIIVVDELLRGADPESASEGDEIVATKLFMNTNLITLFATHHSNMTELESRYPSGAVKNYKIDAYRNDKERYVFTYKIQPGISQVNIARDLFDKYL